MNRLLSILFLLCVYSHLYAQTPYDAFAPEMSRPILDVVQDMDTYKDSLQSSPMDAPLATTDDVSKWLSPDPLCDKYPEISPYAYCGWNPIKYVDPDGRKVGMSGAYRNEDGTTSIATFYYGEVDGVRGFYHNGQRLGNEFANKATDAIGKIHDGGKYGKMLVDAVVKDDRTINLNQVRKPKDNASKCALKALFWCVDDFKPGSEDVPSFITLSHEFGHFLTNWYNIADYGTWYDGVPNDEKLVVNFENLIRNENHLDTRKYYGFPSTPGGHGEGEIPQWDWVGNYLEIITNGL